jgi:hypothetical protein
MMTYNGAVVSPCYVPLKGALGDGDAWLSLWSLFERLGAPRALRDLGMPEKRHCQSSSAVHHEPILEPNGSD